MFAVIQTGGKQLFVKPGQLIWVEKINQSENEIVIFDKILMINEEIGSPYLKKAKIKATIIKQGKAKKIIVFKYKPKKNYKRKYGHRQPHTQVRIDEISLTGSFKTKKELKQIEKPKVKTTLKQKTKNITRKKAPTNSSNLKPTEKTAKNVPSGTAIPKTKVVKATRKKDVINNKENKY